MWYTPKKPLNYICACVTLPFPNELHCQWLLYARKFHSCYRQRVVIRVILRAPSVSLKVSRKLDCKDEFKINGKIPMD